MKNKFLWVLLVLSLVVNIFLIGCRSIDQGGSVQAENSKKIRAIAETLNVKADGEDSDAVVLNRILYRFSNVTVYDGPFMSEKDKRILNTVAELKNARNIVQSQEDFLKKLQGKKLIILPGDQAPAAQK